MIRLSPSLSAPALTLGLLLALVPALGCSTGEAPPSIENATGPVSATPPAKESAGAAEAGAGPQADDDDDVIDAEFEEA